MNDNPPPHSWLATASEKAAARGPLGLGALAIALGFVALLTGAPAITIATVALLLVVAGALVVVSAHMDKASHNDQPAQHNNPEISAPPQRQQDSPNPPVEAVKSESEQRPNDEA
jgi:flagellar biosynthesis component FlhA